MAVGRVCGITRLRLMAVGITVVYGVGDAPLLYISYYGCDFPDIVKETGSEYEYSVLRVENLAIGASPSYRAKILCLFLYCRETVFIQYRLA